MVALRPTLLGKASRSIARDYFKALSHHLLTPCLIFDAQANLDISCRFACAAYRRNTNFIRVPTTVIGLIDASVSIKVAVNYGNYKVQLLKNRLMNVFINFTEQTWCLPCSDPYVPRFHLLTNPSYRTNPQRFCRIDQDFNMLSLGHIQFAR